MSLYRELTLEQHEFELCRLLICRLFYNKYIGKFITSNAVRSMIRMINSHWNAKLGSHCSLPREFQITNSKG